MYPEEFMHVQVTREMVDAVTWPEILGRFIEANCPEELAVMQPVRTAGRMVQERGYGALSFEQRVRLLSYLCAEVLETDDIRDVVKSLGGADVVYDPVGGDQFKAALRASNPEARILPLGFASGEVPQIPANILLVKNLTVIGYYWGGYSKIKPSVLTDSFAQLIAWYQDGKLTPHISRTLPLADCNEGLDLLRTRKATGKVIIEIG